jgi:hypothetical protein
LPALLREAIPLGKRRTEESPQGDVRRVTELEHRTVTTGFRSEWGAHPYAALATVIETAKLRQHTVFDTLVNLMGCQSSRSSLRKIRE